MYIYFKSKEYIHVENWFVLMHANAIISVGPKLP
jgi:hypothetical protein